MTHELVLVRLHPSGTSEWRCLTCGREEVRMLVFIWVRQRGADVPHHVAPDPLGRLGTRYVVLPPRWRQLN